MSRGAGTPHSIPADFRGAHWGLYNLQCSDRPEHAHTARLSPGCAGAGAERRKHRRMASEQHWQPPAAEPLWHISGPFGQPCASPACANSLPSFTTFEGNALAAAAWRALHLVSATEYLRAGAIQ
eukprot:1148682-Pelagomonas_calceolata.AAC.6